MKNTLLLSVAVGALALPAVAQDQGPQDPGLLKLSGEVLLTYGNTQYSDNEYLGLARLNAEGRKDFGAVALKYRGELTYRTDMEDLPADMDDPYNVDIGLDMGGFGTLGYSTYHRCAGVGFPWTDGDVGNLGSANMHPWVPSTYRCAGGLDVVAAQGGGIDARDHVYYTNKIGRLSVNAWYDEDLTYGKFDGNETMTFDGELPASFEWELGFDADVARLMIGANDLGDQKAAITVPIPALNMDFTLEKQHKDAETGESDGQIITAVYHPQNMGPLRVIRADAWHVEDALGETYDNWMVDVRLGEGPWELGMAYEGQGNFALEGAYKLRDNVSIVAGYDNGFEDGDGWSAAYGPPTSVPGRDESYEIGIKITF